MESFVTAWLSPIPSLHPPHSVLFVILSSLRHYWSPYFVLLLVSCHNLEPALAFGLANLALPDLFENRWLQTLWPGHCLSSSFWCAFAVGTHGYPVQHRVSIMLLAHTSTEDNANTQMYMWISAKYLFVQSVLWSKLQDFILILDEFSFSPLGSWVSPWWYHTGMSSYTKS